MQYADYAVWQHEFLGDEGGGESVLSRQLDFWRGELAGLPERLVLPVDRERPEVASFRGGVVDFRVPADVHERLVGLARSSRASVFMVVQSALAVLLSRLGAGDDIPVGTTTAGRGDPVLDDLVGVFMNSLVLRADVSGDPSFSDVVGRVRAADLRAYAHQDVPFERLVEELNPVRSLGWNPLFQVLLEVHGPGADGGEGGGLSLAGVEVVAERVVQPAAKFDLSFTLFEERDSQGRPSGLSGVLEFAEDLFDRGTVEVLADRFVRVLGSVVGNPGARVSEVEVLSPGEREMVLGEWNDTGLPVPEATVSELFEEWVRRVPDAVAVVECSGAEVSYGELNARANRVAHVLRGMGVGPESFVGVCLDHGVDMFAALLGVLKAGGAYVPLDPSHPVERLEFILADTGTGVVVTREGLRGVLPADYRGVVLSMDGDRPRLEAASSADPGRIAVPDNPVYVMYTSGSTGRPKGVVVPHRGVVNYLWWAIAGYGIEEGSGAPMVGSIAFDLSVPNFFLPLIAGKSVTLLPEGPEELAALLRRPGDFSLLKITPGHADLLRAQLADGERLDSVRTYVIGADEVRPDTVAAMRRIAPDARIIDEYGPTETVVGCSVYEIGEDFNPSVPVSIGRPIGNIRMYVLDRWMCPVPAGVTGELFIAGTGVARGYLNRPALTAERFLPDPWGAPGTRMYRTGDQARFRPDGNIDFLGRLDDQVKIRGYRVELGEIEARLLLHPDVATAAVTARQDAGGAKHLAAYVVMRKGAAATTGDIRRDLADALPDYMIPTFWTLLDRLPLTTAGKIDRKALPDPAPAASSTGRPPNTPTQHLLCDLISELLHTPHTTLDDNFFNLGGHSLIAVQLAALIRRRTGVRISTGDIFRAATIAELAQRVTENGGIEEFDPLLTIVEKDAGTPLFCVHPADGISWTYYEFARNLAPDYPVYALQNPQHADPDLVRESLPGMAAEYVERMRTVRAKGPYRLVGWCFGAVIAYEIACQLQRAGETVDFLALVGPHPIGWQSEAAPLLPADTYRALIAGFPSVAPGDAPVDATRNAAVASLRGNDVMRGRFSADHIPRAVDIYRNMDEIEANYRPLAGGFTGDVLVLASAREEMEGRESVVRSWRPYVTGSVEIEMMDCATDDMLTREYGAHTARRISDVLSQLDD
ncbi:amino acid adenylation domain-containing protein [Streptomyces xiamenensis]|uniref:non-ribosomal peptide synthetase n=1 Tax=Streptomyces xiamenensis TaxID=408015 RepID=UPI0036E58360